MGHCTLGVLLVPLAVLKGTACGLVGAAVLLAATVLQSIWSLPQHLYYSYKAVLRTR